MVFDQLKRTQVTPLLVTLHWLPVAAKTKCKYLTLAYRTATGSAPSFKSYDSEVKFPIVNIGEY